MHLLDRNELQSGYLKFIDGLEVPAVRDILGQEYIIRGSNVPKLKNLGYELEPAGIMRVRIGNEASYKKIFRLIEKN